MKTLTINGINFELTTPRKPVAPVGGYIGNEYDIYQWYGRPSECKVAIWHEWIRWAYQTDGIEVFKISSANCMQFSITGLYIDEDGNEYNLWITRDHNRAIKVG